MRSRHILRRAFLSIQVIKTAICIFSMCSILVFTSCVSHDENEGNAVIIQQGEYYRVQEINQQFYCILENNKHATVRVEGPFPKEPNIRELSKNIIKFTYQTGTGLATQWGFYYSPDDGLFSPIYQCIHDEYEEKVACSTSNSVIVYEMFAQSQNPVTIITFSKTLAPVADPFVEVRFINNNKVSVSYLTSEDYAVTTEEYEIA